MPISFFVVESDKFLVHIGISKMLTASQLVEQHPHHAPGACQETPEDGDASKHTRCCSAWPPVSNSTALTSQIKKLRHLLKVLVVFVLIGYT